MAKIEIPAIIAEHMETSPRSDNQYSLIISTSFVSNAAAAKESNAISSAFVNAAVFLDQEPKLYL